MVKSKAAVVENVYGHGRSWLRGELVGKGSSGSVFKATLKNTADVSCIFFPEVMAVKSAEMSDSSSLQKERMVLNNLGTDCPHIRLCYGEEVTTCPENGQMMVYNLLLEYGSGGTLRDLIKKSGLIGLPEHDVKSYTKNILMGIRHTHVHGYVHRDLDPNNILLFPASGNHIAKISDYGSAKLVSTMKRRRLTMMDAYLRGKTMYLSPEAVMLGVQETPSDIWALGCIVVEMLTGKTIWEGKSVSEIEDFLCEVGEGERDLVSMIPTWISHEAKDFLEGCFVSDPKNRWTAEQLLRKPFVAGTAADDFSLSKQGPRSKGTSKRHHKLMPTKLIHKTSYPRSTLRSIWFPFMQKG